jgi:hypothetical protein
MDGGEKIGRGNSEKPSENGATKEKSKKIG